ncbi:hypothetical protein MMPV_006503 [Pyropia vietnamensis]
MATPPPATSPPLLMNGSSPTPTLPHPLRLVAFTRPAPTPPGIIRYQLLFLRGSVWVWADAVTPASSTGSRFGGLDVALGTATTRLVGSGGVGGGGFGGGGGDPAGVGIARRLAARTGLGIYASVVLGEAGGGVAAAVEATLLAAILDGAAAAVSAVAQPVLAGPPPPTQPIFGGW